MRLIEWFGCYLRDFIRKEYFRAVPKNRRSNPVTNALKKAGVYIPSVIQGRIPTVLGETKNVKILAYEQDELKSAAEFFKTFKEKYSGAEEQDTVCDILKKIIQEERSKIAKMRGDIPPGMYDSLLEICANGLHTFKNFYESAPVFFGNYPMMVIKRMLQTQFVTKIDVHNGAIETNIFIMHFLIKQYLIASVDSYCTQMRENKKVSILTEEGYEKGQQEIIHSIFKNCLRELFSVDIESISEKEKYCEIQRRVLLTQRAMTKQMKGSHKINKLMDSLDDICERIEVFIQIVREDIKEVAEQKKRELASQPNVCANEDEQALEQELKMDTEMRLIIEVLNDTRSEETEKTARENGGKDWDAVQSMFQFSPYTTSHRVELKGKQRRYTL